jgi:hypothetical protein
MYRRHVPTEFGFSTSAYVPPEHPRPLWRTLVCGALLTIIPLVGPAVSAIYIDRRQIPSTYAFGDALKTALIQILAVLVVVLIVAVILTALGFTVQLAPQITRSAG